MATKPPTSSARASFDLHPAHPCAKENWGFRTHHSSTTWNARSLEMLENLRPKHGLSIFIFDSRMIGDTKGLVTRVKQKKELRSLVPWLPLLALSHVYHCKIAVKIANPFFWACGIWWYVSDIWTRPEILPGDHDEGETILVLSSFLPSAVSRWQSKNGASLQWLRNKME